MEENSSALKVEKEEGFKREEGRNVRDRPVLSGRRGTRVSEREREKRISYSEAAAQKENRDGMRVTDARARFFQAAAAAENDRQMELDVAGVAILEQR